MMDVVQVVESRRDSFHLEKLGRLAGSMALTDRLDDL